MSNPTGLTDDSVAEIVRNFWRSDAGKVVRTLIVHERGKAIEEGKKFKRPEDWSVIDGIDRVAVKVFEKWANWAPKPPKDEPPGEDE